MTNHLATSGLWRPVFALKVAFAFGGLGLLLPYFMETYLSNIVPYRYIEILLYLPAAALGVICWFHTKSVAKHPAILFFLILVGASIIWTDSTEMRYSFLYLINIGFAVPLSIYITREAALVICVRWMIVSTIVLFALTILLSDFGLSGQSIRLGHMAEAGTSIVGFNANQIGRILGFGALLAFAMSRRFSALQRTQIKNANRRVYLVAFVVLFAGTLATVSRTAIAATMLSLILIAFGQKRMRRVYAVVLLSIIVAGLALIITSLGESSLSATGGVSGEFAGRVMSPDAILTANGRLPLWIAAISTYLKSDDIVLLFGVGLIFGGLQVDTYAMGKDAILRASAHSSIVDVVVGLGIVGVAALIWVATVVYRRSARLDRSEQSFERRALWLYWFVICLTGTMYRDLYWPPVLALLIALLSPRARSSGAEMRMEFKSTVG